MRYSYEAVGTAYDGQSWMVSGEVETEKPGEITYAVNRAIGMAFMAVTGGRAIYGKPGVGCRGPYMITRFLIEERRDA